MAKKYGRVISIRIPEKLNDRIEAAIATGKYRNKADYVMAALRAFDDGLGEIETGGGCLPSKQPIRRMIDSCSNVGRDGPIRMNVIGSYLEWLR